MIAPYDSYLSLALLTVYQAREIRKVTNKNPKICIPSADFFVNEEKNICVFAKKVVPLQTIRKIRYAGNETKTHTTLRIRPMFEKSDTAILY